MGSGLKWASSKLCMYVHTYFVAISCHVCQRDRGQSVDNAVSVLLAWNGPMFNMKTYIQAHPPVCLYTLCVPDVNDKSVRRNRRININLWWTSTMPNQSLHGQQQSFLLPANKLISNILVTIQQVISLTCCILIRLSLHAVEIVHQTPPDYCKYLFYSAATINYSHYHSGYNRYSLPHDT